jgi:hypothetical protein
MLTALWKILATEAGQLDEEHISAKELFFED